MSLRHKKNSIRNKHKCEFQKKHADVSVFGAFSVTPRFYAWSCGEPVLSNENDVNAIKQENLK